MANNGAMQSLILKTTEQADGSHAIHVNVDSGGGGGGGLTDAQLRAAPVATLEPATLLTGAAAQTAVVANILTDPSGTAGVDVANFRSASVQVVSTGTGGTFIFEQSIDNVNWRPLPVFNAELVTNVAITAAITASASQIIYTFPLRARFLRLRIATTITGGSIQAFTRLSSEPWTSSATQAAVTQATASNFNAQVVGSTAHDAVLAGNPVRVGARAVTANYTAVATGDVADLISTTVGAQIHRPFSIPELDWQAALTITGNTSVDIQAAAGAGLKRYLTGLQYQNTNATATTFSIRRGTTVIANFNAPATMAVPATITLLTPLQTAANEALNVIAATTGANIFLNAQGYTAP